MYWPAVETCVTAMLAPRVGALLEVTLYSPQVEVIGEEGEEAGGVSSIDEEAKGGAGDLGGGGAGGQRREVELEEGGEAVADGEVGEGTEVDGGLRGRDVGVGEEGGGGGAGGDDGSEDEEGEGKVPEGG